MRKYLINNLDWFFRVSKGNVKKGWNRDVEIKIKTKLQLNSRKNHAVLIVSIELNLPYSKMVEIISKLYELNIKSNINPINKDITEEKIVNIIPFWIDINLNTKVLIFIIIAVRKALKITTEYV